MLSDVAAYARVALGLPGFLRRPCSLADAHTAFRQRLHSRSENFLMLVERAVFGWAESPYRRLFQLAGCEFGDLRQLVRSRGLEPALETLAGAGVYLTFEEFKGRAPIVRHGVEVPATPRSFDNPWLTRHYYSETGGSTGRAPCTPTI
jgi:hypothetical protein